MLVLASLTAIMLNCEAGATKIAYVVQYSLDLELPAICMVEISMMAMMSNCVREHVNSKIAYVVQCSLDLELHVPYGGNLNDGNDVELCEGACIYNKDCVCYAVLLDLESLY